MRRGRDENGLEERKNVHRDTIDGRGRQLIRRE